MKYLYLTTCLIVTCSLHGSEKRKLNLAERHMLEAAGQGKLSKLSATLRSGAANINATGPDGMTALARAACGARPRAVEILLANNADPLFPCKDLLTARTHVKRHKENVERRRKKLAKEMTQLTLENARLSQIEKKLEQAEDKWSPSPAFDNCNRNKANDLAS